MSTTTLQFTLLKNNVLYDATSIAMPAGVVRLDTGALVVPAGTNAFTRVSVGTYSFVVSDPAPGLTYSYTVVAEVDGLTYSQPLTQTNVNGVPTSIYWTYTQFQNRWGIKNIAKVSNKDGNSTDGNYQSIQDSFDYAVDELHNAQRGGLIGVPFNFGPWSGVVPSVVSRWGMVIAYADLYDVRGWEDRNKVYNKLERLLCQTYDDMRLYKCGIKQLDVVPNTDHRGHTQDLCPKAVNWTIPYMMQSGVSYGGFNMWGWSTLVPDGVLTWFNKWIYAS